MRQEIPLFKVFMSESAPTEVGRVLSSGFIGQGPKVTEFENLLKDRLETDYLATTNSATSAEHLVFHLLKQLGYIKTGDEVLTTSQTCTDTNMPIIANNLRIKWVDVDPRSINMDLLDLERKISSTTKVIYLTNWGGMPHDFITIDKIVQKTKDKLGFTPIVIQDCAHAWGSKLHGKNLCDYGDYSTYSFQAIKHLTTSDGGMVVCNKHKPQQQNLEFINNFILQRWYGIDRNQKRNDFRCEEDIKNWGYKFHMNDVCATMGICNLKHTDWVVSSHQKNAKYYDEHLKNINGLTLLERKSGFESSFWIYSILVEDRSSFTKWMKECGISVSQVHERNDKHTCFKEFKTHLPNLDSIIGKLTHIPVGWWVTSEDREYIRDCIRKGW